MHKNLIHKQYNILTRPIPIPELNSNPSPCTHDIHTTDEIIHQPHTLLTSQPTLNQTHPISILSHKIGRKPSSNSPIVTTPCPSIPFIYGNDICHTLSSPCILGPHLLIPPYAANNRMEDITYSNPTDKISTVYTTSPLQNIHTSLPLATSTSPIHLSIDHSTINPRPLSISTTSFNPIHITLTTNPIRPHYSTITPVQLDIPPYEHPSRHKLYHKNSDLTVLPNLIRIPLSLIQRITHMNHAI